MKQMISTGAMRNIALVGISKNAGKTSVLNSILRTLPDYCWGVFSTGIDGETEDRVFKTPKPQVILNPGTIFCCDAVWADFQGSAVSILQAEEYAGRKLFIVRAEASLETQIMGPSTVAGQRRMISLMHKLGAQKVLVDGSLDRKSIALEETIDMLVLAVGASFGNPEAVIPELQRLLGLRDIPQAKLGRYEERRLKGSEMILIKQKGRWRTTGITSLIKRENALGKAIAEGAEALYIPGSVTDAVYEKLSATLVTHPTSIIVRHPECLKLKLINLQKIQRNSEISCLVPFKLKAFALNSTAIGANQVQADFFRQEIREAFPQESFIDIMEIE